MARDGDGREALPAGELFPLVQAAWGQARGQRLAAVVAVRQAHDLPGPVKGALSPHILSENPNVGGQDHEEGACLGPETGGRGARRGPRRPGCGRRGGRGWKGPCGPAGGAAGRYRRRRSSRAPGAGARRVRAGRAAAGRTRSRPGRGSGGRGRRAGRNAPGGARGPSPPAADNRRGGLK